MFLIPLPLLSVEGAVPDSSSLRSMSEESSDLSPTYPECVLPGCTPKRAQVSSALRRSLRILASGFQTNLYLLAFASSFVPSTKTSEQGPMPIFRQISEVTSENILSAFGSTHRLRNRQKVAWLGVSRGMK